MRDGHDEDGRSHLNTEGLRMIAKSIAQNFTLQSFAIDMENTSITDQTGVEIAKSIAQNSTLQSFAIYMGRTSITDQTGVEIAKSIAQNSTLQSVAIHMSASIIGETGVEIVDPITKNCNLLECRMNLKIDDQLLKVMLRNRGLLTQCRNLVAVARHGGCFGCLTNKSFRQKIFLFFLPPDYVPAQAFMNLGMMPDLRPSMVFQTSYH
jgi:hypothetical protein